MKNQRFHHYRYENRHHSHLTLPLIHTSHPGPDSDTKTFDWIVCGLECDYFLLDFCMFKSSQRIYHFDLPLEFHPELKFYHQEMFGHF